jgi:hypothetical protein
MLRFNNQSAENHTNNQYYVEYSSNCKDIKIEFGNETTIEKKDTINNQNGVYLLSVCPHNDISSLNITNNCSFKANYVIKYYYNDTIEEKFDYDFDPEKYEKTVSIINDKTFTINYTFDKLNITHKGEKVTNTQYNVQGLFFESIENERLNTTAFINSKTDIECQVIVNSIEPNFTLSFKDVRIKEGDFKYYMQVKMFNKIMGVFGPFSQKMLAYHFEVDLKNELYKFPYKILLSVLIPILLVIIIAVFLIVFYKKRKNQLKLRDKILAISFSKLNRKMEEEDDDEINKNKEITKDKFI